MTQSQRQGLRRLAIAALAGLAASLASPVLAACYDVLGCTDRNAFSAHYGYLAAPDGPTCDFLYTMRNSIYAEHGYCFKTARAIQELGNNGCHINDMSAVPLSQIERNNIATIQRAERAKRCPA
ncbi:MAG TPA: YARHG domain-containing protein [Caulobacteraceae bacterium]|nr:YARHG domain-containing protein [Caulobacteraceae bacterium]